MFVGDMSVMSVSGPVMAAVMPEQISIIVGLLALYLVTTALLTVRRPGLMQSYSFDYRIF